MAEVLVSLSLRSFSWSRCNSEASVMENEPFLDVVVEKGSVCFCLASYPCSEIESELAMI